MRNEKLVPTTLPDPREREPYLPTPNGDNKLTAAMVPYYTGQSIQVQYLFFTYVLKFLLFAFCIVYSLFL